MTDQTREPNRLQSSSAAPPVMGFWSWDLETGHLSVDTQAAAIFGLPDAGSLTESTLEALHHPEDWPLAKAARDAALDPQGKGEYRIECRILPGTDSTAERYALIMGKTEKQGDKPVRLVGVVCDMTSTQAVEKARRRSEERLSGILAIAADAIISVDENHRIILFNHGAETTFGYASAEAKGQSLDILLPERFRKGHADLMRRFVKSSAPSRRMGERREIYGRRKNGEEFPAEASISQIELDGERTLTVVLRDVTARKATEQALAQANRELEDRVLERTRALSDEMHRREQTQAALSRSQRMEAFGQLAGGIAHDFNNLLTVISGNQELLEMRLEDPKALALLKRSQTAAEMGARLTSRLLTFARRRHLEPAYLNLNEQITGMVELLRRSLGEHITLTTDLAPKLGTVRADPSEVENAVLNLAINARDAMPKGGTLVIETANFPLHGDEPTGDVKLPPGDYVRVSVSDTGTGMMPEVLSRAFEPFFTTKQPGKGTGLGLSTIYGFAQLSGGTVTAYSEVGRGTTINIYLPRVNDPSVDEPQSRATEAIEPAHGEHILLVEDRPDVREVTRSRIENLGYRVTEVESGQAAIDILQKGTEPPFDLVFSDVVMPGGISGYDVARWVQRNRPDLNIVLSSGFADQVAAAQGGELPVVKLLRKPYTRSELAQTLRNGLKR